MVPRKSMLMEINECLHVFTHELIHWSLFCECLVVVRPGSPYKQTVSRAVHGPGLTSRAGSGRVRSGWPGPTRETFKRSPDPTRPMKSPGFFVRRSSNAQTPEDWVATVRGRARDTRHTALPVAVDVSTSNRSFLPNDVQYTHQLDDHQRDERQTDGTYLLLL